MVGDECCHVKELFQHKQDIAGIYDNQLMKTSREIIAVLSTKEEYKCIGLQCGGCRPIWSSIYPGNPPVHWVDFYQCTGWISNPLRPSPQHIPMSWQDVDPVSGSLRYLVFVSIAYFKVFTSFD